MGYNFSIDSKGGLKLEGGFQLEGGLKYFKEKFRQLKFQHKNNNW